MKGTLINGKEVTFLPMSALTGYHFVKVEFDAEDAFRIVRGDYQNFTQWLEHLLSCRMYPKKAPLAEQPMNDIPPTTISNH